MVINTMPKAAERLQPLTRFPEKKQLFARNTSSTTSGAEYWGMKHPQSDKKVKPAAGRFFCALFFLILLRHAPSLATLVQAKTFETRGIKKNRLITEAVSII